MDPLTEGGSGILPRRGPGYRVPTKPEAQVEEVRRVNPEYLRDGMKGKSARDTFFRVPRPPKGRPGFLPHRKEASLHRGDPHHREGLQVEVGSTTGVELVLLLGEIPQNKDEMSHNVYYFVETESGLHRHAMFRNPYELVLAAKADCQGKDVFYTITRSGVTEFSRKNGTETTPLLDWLKFRNMFNMIHKDPFRFPLMKVGEDPETHERARAQAPGQAR